MPHGQLDLIGKEPRKRPRIYLPDGREAVVHCKRSEYDVYVGRPTKWGNPFTHKADGTLAEFVVSTREEAIARYREWLVNQPDLMDSLDELRGKVLGCWCAPQPCHADVLAELANR